MTGALALLISSPRIPPGLLSRAAWQAVESATSVWAREPDEPTAAAIAATGIQVRWRDEPPAVAARALVAAATSERVVWIGSCDGDPGLTDAIASEVSRLGEPPEIEVLVGSWDPPGARLLDVVAVMDRLRSPGGCPWDAEQTHTSLLPYLHEEATEYADAVASGDRVEMAEELGDVLLQVAFHARVAQDDPDEPFDIDTVAGVLVEKLVRRHPHVFADSDASTPEEVEAQWAQIKAAEKAAKAEKASRATKSTAGD